MSNISETNQLDVGGWSPDTLHAWVRSMLDQIDRRNEQRFREQEQALEKALTASNSVAAANFNERDKAIAILASAMREQVVQAEKNLREHISNQIEQIRSALMSADALEVARVEGVKTAVNSVHREIDIETKANKEAVDKADKANEKRFESVNEFRAQMADQSALFISRREVEAMVGSSADKIATLTDRINRSEGRGSGKDQLWVYIVGGITLLLAIMMYLNSNKTESVGKSDLNNTKIEALRDEVGQLKLKNSAPQP